MVNTFYRARYYSPAIGRFLSRDPIGVTGGINLYAYVGNRAVNRLDPMGLFSASTTAFVTSAIVQASMNMGGLGGSDGGDDDYFSGMDLTYNLPPDLQDMQTALTQNMNSAYGGDANAQTSNIPFTNQDYDTDSNVTTSTALLNPSAIYTDQDFYCPFANLNPTPNATPPSTPDQTPLGPLVTWSELQQYLSKVSSIAQQDFSNALNSNLANLKGRISASPSIKTLAYQNYDTVLAWGFVGAFVGGGVGLEKGKGLGLFSGAITGAALGAFYGTGYVYALTNNNPTFDPHNPTRLAIKLFKMLLKAQMKGLISE